MSKIINLLGGPGAGKSKWRAALFATMKEEGIDCEEVTEWIKASVWEERPFVTRDRQVYVFAKQLAAMERVIDKVDVVITDSPIFLSYFYATQYGTKYSPQLIEGILAEYKRLGGISVFIERDPTKYNQKGRMQTALGSDEIADAMRKRLLSSDIPFQSFYDGRDRAALVEFCMNYARG